MKYTAIWQQIKQHGYAEITVSAGYAATVIQGVKRTKSIENTARRLTSKIGWSKLMVTTTKLSDHRTKVRFQLIYPTNL